MSHRRKLVIAIAVVMLVLAGVWVATYGAGPKNEVDAYRESLVAKGEKLEISQVVTPPVPPEQNGVNIVNEALSMLTQVDYEQSSLVPTMRMIAPGKAIVCFQQPDVRSPNSTNSWLNVTTIVEADRPITELLRQGGGFSSINFQIDYNNLQEEGPPIRLVRPLVYSAHRLSAEAICDLRAGDTASAATNICAMIGLANGERDERFFTAQMIRRATASLAASANWELLQSTNINETELAMLQRSWEELEFVRAMENVLLLERARFETTIKKMENSDEYYDHMVKKWGMAPKGSAGDWNEELHNYWYNFKLAFIKYMYRSSWIYSDELQMLQNKQRIVEALRMAETNGFFNASYTNAVIQLHAERATQADNWLTKLDDSDVRHVFLEAGGDQYVVIKATMRAEVTRQILITAIALKRYQLKHGNYPASLRSLVPEFLKAVPMDPVDGKMLRYRVNADGTFLLYSIGDNNIDDGGNGSLEKGAEFYPDIYWLNFDTLDWVWPQPATKAEIEYFYAHPPRYF